MCAVANVSGTVTAHVRHRPLAYGINVTPSGRFPSDRRRPVCSLVDWTPALFDARQIVSFRRLCFACLPALRRQLRQCRPMASTRAPQVHWWGSHNFAPSRRPTATRMVSLDIRKPIEVMGGALIQSSVWAVLKLGYGPYQFGMCSWPTEMLKDCSVIFLSQNFCFP